MRKPPDAKMLASSGPASISGVFEAGASGKIQNATKPVTRQAAWRARNPLAHWAHKAFESALKRGLVERKPCEVCGDPKTDFHHDPDAYDQPLRGRHLCRLHHVHEHRRLRCDEAGAV